MFLLEVEEYVNENINSARLSLEGCPNNVVYGVALRRIIRQAYQEGQKSMVPLAQPGLLEPLGAEFEAVYDENIDKLYEN